MIYQNFQDNKVLLPDGQAKRLRNRIPYFLRHAVTGP